jgi:2-oxoglutarate ferredoxin oxidoreductase subunit delta
MNKIVVIDEDKCIGCGACVDVCPPKILYLKEGKCKVSDESKCGKHKCCEKVCPIDAIKIH